MNINVTTTKLPDGRILQDVAVKLGDAHEQVYRTVIDTKENGVRKALIELGWSPPDAMPRRSTEPETVVFRFSPEAYNLHANGEVSKTRCANDQWPQWARDFYDSFEKAAPKVERFETNTKAFVVGELDALLDRFEMYSVELASNFNRKSERVTDAMTVIRNLRNLFVGT